MYSNQQQAQKIQQLGLLAPEHLRSAMQLVRPNKDLAAVLCEQGLLPQELAPQIRGLEQPSDPLQEATIRSQAAQTLTSIFVKDPHFAPHIAHVLERREELGRGGMGVVYRVLDKRLNREAALKILLSGREDPNDHLRFRREAEVMAQLDHPAIPPIYETGSTPDGEAYLIMKVVEGVTLKQRILKFQYTERDDPEFIEMLRCLVKVAEAMAFAHSKGFIHRDLKPANIMIGEFGEVQIMDWGLAREMGKSESRLARASMSIDPETASKFGLTAEGVVLGTPGYMAPEQITSSDLDGRVDIYALGCILTELLTGRLPVKGSSPLECLIATMHGEILSPRQLNAAIPKELDLIVESCLEVERNDRMESMEQFGQRLLAFIERREASPMLGRVIAGAAVVAVFFLVVAFSWFASNPGDFESSGSEQQLKNELKELKEKLADQKPVVISEPSTKLTYTEKVALLLRQNKSGRELELKLAGLDKDVQSPSDFIDSAEMCEDLRFIEFKRSILTRARRMYPKSNQVLFKSGGVAVSLLTRVVANESREILRGDVEDGYFWATKAIVLMQESSRRSAMSADLRREILSYMDKAIRMSPKDANCYFARGYIRFALRDFENAHKDYDTAIELRPRKALYYLYRANLRMSGIFLTLQRTGETDRSLLALSIADAEMARRLDGNLVAIDISLGRLLQFAGRMSEARSSFLSVIGNKLASEGERVEALMGVGSLYEQEEQYADAIVHYRRALAIGKDPRSRQSLARAQVLNEDFRAALDAWIEIAKKRGDAYSLLFLARCYLGLNNPLKALGELTKIRGQGELIGPMAYDYCYYSGLTLSKLSRFSEARPLLQQAVRLFPQLIDSRIELINVYVQLKRFKGASAQLRETKGFHPKNLKLVIAEISCQIAQGDFDGAIQTHDRAVLANLDKESLIIERAKIFRAQSQVDAAGKQLNLAMRLNEKNPQTHFMLGEILHEKNQFRAAYLAFSRAYTLNYPDLRIQLKLGGLAMELRDFRSALLHYNLFLRRTLIYKPSAYILRAEAYHRLSNYEAALRDVNETLRSSRGEVYALGYFARARISISMGNKKNAILDYRRFLDLTKNEDRWDLEKQAAETALNRLENQ